MCVWGCEGNNLDDIKVRNDKEAQRKADEEAAMRRGAPPVPMGEPYMQGEPGHGFE